MGGCVCVHFTSFFIDRFVTFAPFGSLEEEEAHSNNTASSRNQNQKH